GSEWSPYMLLTRPLIVLPLSAKRRRTQISPRLIDTISITGLLPPGRRQKVKSDHTRSCSSFAHDPVHLRKLFEVESRPINAFELGVDQCARRFENGMSIRYALRSDKDGREVQYLRARGLLSVFVCDNSS